MKYLDTQTDRRGYTEEEWREYNRQWTEDEWEDWRARQTGRHFHHHIPTDQAGVGTTDADELSATMHGGTHCQDPSIAKSNVVASENFPFAFEVVPEGTLCL